MDQLITSANFDTTADTVLAGLQQPFYNGGLTYANASNPAARPHALQARTATETTHLPALGPSLAVTATGVTYGGAAIANPSYTVLAVLGALGLAALLDRHCAFPGCRQKPAACQAHHLIPRAKGGVTGRAERRGPARYRIVTFMGMLNAVDGPAGIRTQPLFID